MLTHESTLGLRPLTFQALLHLVFICSFQPESLSLSSPHIFPERITCTHPTVWTERKSAIQCCTEQGHAVDTMLPGSAETVLCYLTLHLFSTFVCAHFHLFATFHWRFVPLRCVKYTLARVATDVELHRCLTCSFISCRQAKTHKLSVIYGSHPTVVEQRCAPWTIVESI